MKKLLLLSLALCLTLGINAQNDDTSLSKSDRLAEKMTQRMVERLSLDEKQEAELLKINESFSSSTQLLREKGLKPSSDEYQKVKDAYKSEVSGILNEEQAKNFEENFTPRMERAGQNKSEFKRAEKQEQRESMRTMKENLSEEEKAKMEKGKQQVATYAERNIIPALQALRADFDQRLSAEEKEQIQALRVEKAKRVAEKKASCTSGDRMQGDRSGPRGAQRMGDNESWGKSKEQLASILKNHEASMKEVKAKLEPLQAQWKADLDRIRAAYFPSEILEARSERGDRRKGSIGKYQKFMKGAGFLLLDQNAEPSEILEQMKDRKKAKACCAGGKKAPNMERDSKRVLNAQPTRDK